MAMQNEVDLVKALQRGDSSAFATFVESLGPRLTASATRMLGNRDEAQDSVQETLLSVWKNIKKFEGASSLYTWVYRILINFCLARLRTASAGKETRFSTLENESRGEEATLKNATQDQQGPGLEKRIAMRRAIERALQQIPEEFRAVLLLRDVEELSSKEASALLGIPDSLVRQRLHRARTVMAEILRPELCSGPELTCGGQLNLLMDFIDGLLPPETVHLVDSHIASCGTCSNLLSVYRATIGFPKALRELTSNTELSREFVSRILAQAQARSGD